MREGSTTLPFHEKREGSPAGAQVDRRTASSPLVQRPLPPVPQEDEGGAGPGPGHLAVRPPRRRPSRGEVRPASEGSKVGPYQSKTSSRNPVLSLSRRLKWIPSNRAI